jgi:hypothetical protein
MITSITTPIGNSSATVTTVSSIGCAPNTSLYTVAGGGTGTIILHNGITGQNNWTNSTTNSTLEVQGDANFAGDVKIKGNSIVDLIDNIEKRLAILHPNLELEDKWEELKSLGTKYRKLESEILEKEKIWTILKK